MGRLDRASRFGPQQETFFNSSFSGLNCTSLSSLIATSPIGVDYQVAEKVIFRRLLKNSAQMLGALNPESGRILGYAATTKGLPQSRGNDADAAFFSNLLGNHFSCHGPQEISHALCKMFCLNQIQAADLSPFVPTDEG